jgi:hypothetical protein
MWFQLTNVWLTSPKSLIQNERNLDPTQEIEPARLPAIQLMPACRVIVRANADRKRQVLKLIPMRH